MEVIGMSAFQKNLNVLFFQVSPIIRKIQEIRDNFDVLSYAKVFSDQTPSA